MEVRPVHQLSSSLLSSPKLFACVLGSGVSRAAGISTGWQIVLDLVQRYAEQAGEGEAAAPDPAAWYVARHGREPDYSEVVSKLAPTTELRRNLLERYFTVHDPLSGQRKEHAPTEAHRAIARLVRRGLLRVIVTTNFDRLMENALKEEGVAHVEVISSPAEAANGYPFHATDAYVFKLHGDWRDTGLLNSRQELAAYPRELVKLLRRILGEHGLIVCGWSAEYDVALREAIERYQRRFPAFFVDPKPGASAKKIVEHLRATAVSATADEFFSELELSVAAFARQRPPPALSGDVLVARARRFIAEENEMELDDLVQDATRSLCVWIETELKVQPPKTDDVRLLAEFQRELFEACESHAKPLAQLLATLARYRQASYLAQRALSALLSAAEEKARPLRSFEDGWWWFFSYPALLCAHAHGVASCERGAFEAAISAVRDAGSGHVERELRLPPSNQEYFAVASTRAMRPQPDPLAFSRRISTWLFPLTEAWIPRRADFELAFDRFDVLLCAMSWRPGMDPWRPRCAFERDAAEGPSARRSFQDIVEDWLIQRLGRQDSDGRDDVLWTVFLGIDESAQRPVFDRLREWKPPA
jgi:hypothetical protein